MTATNKTLDKDFDYFVKNAISCWLHHFPDHQWTPIYKELVQRDFTPKPNTPRPAKKARRTKRVLASNLDAID